MSAPTRTRTFRILGSTALGAAMLLTAACGSGSANAKPTTSAAAATAGGAGGGSGAGSRAAFDACVRKNGATPGAGGGPGGGFQSMSPQMRQAFQACRSLLPNGGRFGGQNSAAMAAFRTCMKSHGVDVGGPSGAPGQQGGPGQGSASPATGGAGQDRGPLRGLNTTDPKVAAALQICRPLIPSRTGSPAPATS